jgi:hypothetical protein
VVVGAEVPQIATFTGHSLEDVQAILDTHYLRSALRLAKSAVGNLGKR